MKKDISGGYYEAIIQLRPFNKKAFEMIVNHLEKRNEAITKFEELKTGKDLYVTSWRAALGIARQIKKQMKAELVTSRSLFTRSKVTCKRVYRVTVCLRFPEV